MLTDDDISDQVTRYFGWLDPQLDSFGNGNAPDSQHNRSGKRRGLLALVATGLVVFLVGGLLWSRSSDHSDRSVAVDAPVSAPFTTTAISSLPGVVAGGEVLGVDPAMLPDGLVVWDVARSVSSMDEPMTMQLFAEPVPAGAPFERGVIVTVTAGGYLGAEPTSQVRGRPAAVLDDGMLVWTEAGVRLEARSKGLSVDETVAALDELEFRADPIDGFDPGSASTLELVTETVSGPGLVSELTSFRIGQPDQAPGSYEVTTDNEPPIVVIGTGLGIAAPPEILLYGRPQSDGTIEAPLLAYAPDESRLARYRINDDSSVTTVLGRTVEERAAVMNSTRLLTSTDVESLVRSVSARLQALPEAAAQDLNGIRVIARGGSINDPSALCIDNEIASACRLAFGVLTGEFETQASVANVTVGDDEYVIGVQQQGSALAVARWTPDMPESLPTDQALATTTATAEDGTVYSVTLVPSDVEATIVGVIIDNQITFPVTNQSGSPRRTALD